MYVVVCNFTIHRACSLAVYTIIGFNVRDEVSLGNRNIENPAKNVLLSETVSLRFRIHTYALRYSCDI